ncbi:MAG: ester cyclase [Saprospiraceae bacterium]
MKNVLFSLFAATFLMASCAQPNPKPMATDNAAVSKKAHELFSANKFDEVVNLASDNIQVINYATGQTFNGKEEFRSFMAGFKSAFPDLVIKHTNVFEGANGYVALEFEGTGTHTGPLAGPGGTIPPTGKQVKFIVCEVHQIVNGKIASIHNYQDSGSLMRQLGLMPAPGEAPAN